MLTRLFLFHFFPRAHLTTETDCKTSPVTDRPRHSIAMATDVGKNILYGGPDAPVIDTESRSFGEVILKKLTAHGNNVMFVSIRNHLV